MGPTASDCQSFACICADGNAHACTFGCPRGCTGLGCESRVCDDPVRMCKVLGDVCATHGGVMAVRPASSFDDCEGRGPKDAGTTDAAPTDAAPDARILVPPSL